MRTSILILFTAACSATRAQWQPVTLLPQDPTELCVAGNDKVFALDGSHIIRSFDGGATWSSYPTTFINSWYMGIDFPTPSTGYACGGTAFGEHRACIVKTIDGGLTWDSLTANVISGYALQAIDFVDEQTGFVASDLNGVMKTVDGGATFQSSNGTIQGWVLTLTFVNAQVGFAAAELGLGSGTYSYTIYHTADQGATWTPVHVDVMTNVTGLSHRRINKIQFVDNDNGFAVGGNGTFLRTVDGGLTWSASTLSPPTELTALLFTSPTTGYTNTAGTVQRTNDGGLTWTTQLLQPPAVVRAIAFANDTLGYAIAGDAIYRTANAGGANSISDHARDAKLVLYPNPAQDQLWVQTPTNTSRTHMEIFNSIGVLMLQGIVDPAQAIPIAFLPDGVYQMRLLTDMGSSSAPFVITRTR